MARPVAITGVGALTPIGSDVDRFWDSIRDGRHGMAPVERFSTDEYTCRLAATFRDAPWAASLAARDVDTGPDPCAAIAVVAAREAWRRAGVEAAGIAPERLAVVLGTSTGGLLSRSCFELTPRADLRRRHRMLDRSGFHVQTAVVADAIGADGPRLTISTACTSSAQALIHGRDLLLEGFADVVLVGGSDVVVEEVFAGFHAMGAMSPAPCAPFSEPVGMTLGEGAGFVVIEAVDHARARGAEVLGLLLGAGASADAYHATAPDPTGAGIARALRAAIEDAGLDPEAIDYVNAHGTGTEANDAAEWRALRRVFGARVDTLPVSSTKSYLGHTLGAAGVLELITTLLAMRHEVVPPTLHFTRPRGGGPDDPVASSAPRPARIHRALSCSSAFGGANAAVVIGVAREAMATEVTAADVMAVDVMTATPAAADAAVVIVGAGVLAAHGLHGLDEALRRGIPLWGAVDPARYPHSWSPTGAPAIAATVPAFAMERVARGADPRGMDRVSRYLTAAVALALQQAGVRLHGALRDRTGLCAGMSRLPSDSAEELWDSIKERGYPRISAPAFSRIVMNAAAGAASRALSIRGPASVIAGGPGSGLAAVGLSARALARGGDADLIVAGAAHDLGAELLEDHAFLRPVAVYQDTREPFPIYGMPEEEERPVLGEGAAFFALARADVARAAGWRPLARIAGFGLAGPAHLASAIRQALAAAALGPDQIDAIHGSADGTFASGRREIAALHAVLGDRLGRVPLTNPASVLGSSDSNDALSLAAALEAIRAGRAHPVAGVPRSPGASIRGSVGGEAEPVRAVLVVAADGAGGSAAVILGPPPAG